MKNRSKLRILCWVTTVAMILSIFNVPLLGYAADVTKSTISYSVFTPAFDNNGDNTEIKVTSKNGYDAKNPFVTDDIDVIPYKIFRIIGTYNSGEKVKFTDKNSIIVTSSDSNVALVADEDGYGDTMNKPGESAEITPEEGLLFGARLKNNGTTTITITVDGKLVFSFPLTVSIFCKDCGEYPCECSDESQDTENLCFYCESNPCQCVNPTMTYSLNNGRTIETTLWYYTWTKYDLSLPKSFDSQEAVSIYARYYNSDVKGYVEETITLEINNGNGMYKFNLNGKEYYLNIRIREEISSDTDCMVYLNHAENKWEYNVYSIDMESEDNVKTYTFTLPYNDYQANFSVKACDDVAQIDYSETNEEFSRIAIDRETLDHTTRTFTIIAEDGTKQEYVIIFEPSTGDILDFNVSVHYGIYIWDDFDMNETSISFKDSEILTDENGKPIAVASVPISSNYTNGGIGVSIYKKDNQISIDNDPNGKVFQINDIVTFVAKSANGKNSKTYQISFIMEGEHNHSYGTYKTTTKAKFGKDGVQTATCVVCRDKITKTIAAPKTIKLSYTSCTYNGKVRKPTVTVYDSNGKKINSTNYKVSYASGRKNVGKYKVTVTIKDGRANYAKSSKYTTFKINPKGTSISKLTKGKKSFTVKWKKQSGKMATSRITGYQYRYSTSSKMTNAKTVTVKGYSKTSAKKTKLKANTKYYVQVRAYKTVNGTKYYSSWSKSKTVTTK